MAEWEWYVSQMFSVVGHEGIVYSYLHSGREKHILGCSSETGYEAITGS